MRGGQVFMEALVKHGVDCIFGNPGTTENSLLDRLIDYPQIPYYVALHEGVAVCAASFHAQATGRTAVANLHVAPGLGNAIGMMYGALKAASPLVVTAGQQDTRMRLDNPLLSHDLVAMAAPVTKFSAEPRSADEMGPLLRRAFRIANEPPCGPVFLALPVNVMEEETEIPASTTGPVLAADPSPGAVEQALTLLLESKNPVFVVGDDPSRQGALTTLVDLAEACGATVYHQGLRAHVCFPNRHPNYRGRTPFEAASVRKLLAEHDLVVLIGGNFFEDIWFDREPHIPEGARVLQIDDAPLRLAHSIPVDLGVTGALPATLAALLAGLRDAPARYADGAATRNRALAEEARARQEAAEATLKKLWDASPMAPVRAIHEISRAMPENAIVVDESITASLEVANQFPEQANGDYFGGRGGGIGQGIAGAIGVQVAHPDRRVIAISGDGSAMYSIQALWTAAHHGLPIVFVILSNREYRVLKHNLDIYRARFDVGSNKPYPHMDLTNPLLGFPDMARGMGVPGETVSEADTIGAAMGRALATEGPYLIEIEISGKP
ncbi:MAG: thiamine pyrophosphate-binding protein [Pseudomonadales bacterium]|jgi:benzoylformate decarboxylase